MIPYLVPDLPVGGALLPYLTAMDEARWYTNQGPLSLLFKGRLADTFFPGESPDQLALVSSGTLGLELAIKGLCLKPASRVLLPSLTFPATAATIINCGHRPYFCPVDESGWALSAEQAYDYCAKHQIDLVIPVATFGMPVDGASWDRFSAETGVPVIIDAAGALGQQSLPDNVAVVFSLHATKPFGIGEGGLVASRVGNYLRSIKRARNFGFVDGVCETVGTNAKLSEYHCAVGLAQLERWETLYDKRQALVTCYQSQLAASREVIELQRGVGEYLPSSLVVRVKGKDAGEIEQRLLDQGVQTRRPYWPPLHRHPAFRDCLCIEGLAGQETLYSELLALPFHTHLTSESVGKVSRCLQRSL